MKLGMVLMVCMIVGYLVGVVEMIFCWVWFRYDVLSCMFKINEK